MTIAEIVKTLGNNTKIRRKSWENKRYYITRIGDYFFSLDTDIVTSFSMDDLEADDWEVYTKKMQYRLSEIKRLTKKELLELLPGTNIEFDDESCKLTTVCTIDDLCFLNFDDESTLKKVIFSIAKEK